MTIAERLTGTRKMSWVDRKYHVQKLQQIIPSFDIGEIQKIYLLGYAEESEQAITNIIQCVREASTWGLMRIFNSIPYAEDELGLTVVGNLCSVYLLSNKSGTHTLHTIDSKGYNVKSTEKISDLFHYFLFHKRIVYPTLSLLVSY